MKNASYSRIVVEARRVIEKVFGINAHPLNIKRKMGNEVELTYALGRTFSLGFSGTANRESEDGIALEPVYISAFLDPQHAPKGGWQTWLMSKGLYGTKGVTPFSGGFTIAGNSYAIGMLMR